MQFCKSCLARISCGTTATAFRIAAYRRARDRFFNSVNPPVPPAVTLVEISRLYSERLLIEIEAVAAAQLPEALIATGKQQTTAAPDAKKRGTGRKSHWQEILSAVPRTTDTDCSRENFSVGHNRTRPALEPLHTIVVTTRGLLEQEQVR